MNQYFKSNTTVLFQGDSITEWGRSETPIGTGYPSKVSSIFSALYPNANVTFVNRGVGCDRVRNLLQRYEKDILSVKPDFVSILIGINDTWRRFDENDPCPIERFESEYTELISRIKKDLPNTIIMLITPFLVDLDQKKNCFHSDLNEKIEKVKEIANKFGCILFDFDSIQRNKIESKVYTNEQLSRDGVHPTDFGHSFLAIEYLKRLKIID